MSRQLRVGDRVTATGTVRNLSKYYLDGSDAITVDVDGDLKGSFIFDASALTLIAPAEPPVGSVVVKDGVAWVRSGPVGWLSHDGEYRIWDDISDGEVIFVPGGDA